MDEYDKAFQLWYDELDKFDITDSMTFKQALSKAYFAGGAMGTEKCRKLLAESRQAE